VKHVEVELKVEVEVIKANLWFLQKLPMLLMITGQVGLGWGGGRTSQAKHMQEFDAERR
jgi:hypothetical protein